MKKILMTGVCSAVVMTTAMLFAQVEKPKTINVVGLESDADNTTVKAPAELGVKPQTISLDADALAEKAKEAEQAVASKVNTANVKALTVEGTVIPPSAEMAKTLEEAVRNILVQAGKQIGTVSTNGVELLTMPYQQLGDGKSLEIEWRKALRILLSPVGYNFTEDGELVLFGLAGEVDIKHKQLAQERLTSNRTPILFTTNESEGGMELRNAIRDVSVKADITITTDYMEQSDLYVPVQKMATEGTMTADDIGKAKEKSAVQQTTVKRTTFDTNGQQIEWRIVLREILNPHDYDFVEIGGVVRIAKRAKLSQWEREKEDAKPLVARVVRVYHANPETIVEKLIKMKVLRHPSASVQVVAKENDETEVFRGSQAGVTVGSGTRTGAANIGNSSAFGNLGRPRTPPAIIIFDIEENLASVEEKIRMLDLREKQVLIEAIVFDVSDGNGDDGEKQGIDWGETFRNMQIASGGWDWQYQYAKGIADNWVHSSQNNNGSFQQVPPKEGSNGFTDNSSYSRTINDNKGWDRSISRDNAFNVAFGPINFKAVIDLVNSRSDARILSSPMVVVGDHCETVIQVGTAIPIPITRTSYVGTENASGIQDTEWQVLMTGTTLWISPEVTSDGKSVRLSVHPQLTVPVFNGHVDVNGTEYPEVTSQELDTRVTIPSGCTLLLGGLISNMEEDTESKVWVLGDIPWVGNIFRWRTKTLARRNLMILLRPTILDDEAPDTGYEKPTLKHAEPYQRGLGKTLKLGKSEMDEMLILNNSDAKIVKKLFGKDGEDALETEVESAPAMPEKKEVKSTEPSSESITGQFSMKVPPVSGTVETPTPAVGNKPSSEISHNKAEAATSSPSTAVKSVSPSPVVEPTAADL